MGYPRRVFREEVIVSSDPVDYEKHREKYRPETVRLLFIAESRPAGGTFFYAADSNLFFSTQSAFEDVYGFVHRGFLDFFKSAGCYLEDLCREPVNNMLNGVRHTAHRESIDSLAERINTLRPYAIAVVGLGRSLQRCIDEALKRAKLAEVPRCNLPFPAMSNQPRYRRELSVLIRKLRAEQILPEP
jgi:hypothetical protein